VIAGRAALIVDAGASFLRIHIRGENTARDHRLRVRISTGVARPEVWADAAFGPVRRAPLVVPPEDRLQESPPPTAPLHRYVSCYGPSSGATVYSDGLAEYEVTDDGDVFVTLVRAVGELSRGNLPERPGHAGWPMATPGAQCLGPFECELALLLHGPRSAETMALVERTADDVLLPLRGTTLRSAYAALQPGGGLELAGDGLTFSACKESEDGTWTVLRCVNVTERAVDGAWQLGLPIAEAQLARLDETPLARLSHSAHSVTFVAEPRAIVTILARVVP
jgi:alpha-mannosidase